MPNMSYCRYQNTLSDLQDCYDDMVRRLEQSESGMVDGGYGYEDSLSSDESRAQKRLIELCKRVVELVDE